ncbi:MAG: glutathione S-transferase N-terminal domain-containing protein [Natrialbaceae archaeon]|nr:glutathione S-transferase N-terminal domain-containing protein [Natrialbaceae archaeon]
MDQGLSVRGTGLSGIATGIVLVIGALAVVGGLTGRLEAVISESLVLVGAVALAVLAGSVVHSTVRSRRRRQSDETPVPTAGLELYQSEGCPYCRRVRRFCSDHGISIQLHNPRTAGSIIGGEAVTNADRYDELLEHGQDQIPLLVDTARDEALYESADIIAYLETHYT